MHLTLSRWERRAESATPSTYVSPLDLILANGVELAGEPFRVGELAEAADNVTMTTDGLLAVDGVGGIGG